jgi:hypothetical protein
MATGASTNAGVNDGWENVPSAGPADDGWENVQDVPRETQSTAIDYAAASRHLAEHPPGVPKAPLPHLLEGPYIPPVAAFGPGQYVPVPSAEANASKDVWDPTGAAENLYGGGKRIVQEPTLRGKASGLHQAIGGAFEAGKPLMLGAAAAAPIRTGLSLAAGIGGQMGTEAGAEKLGVPKPYAQLLGDAAGVGVGALAHTVTGKFGGKSGESEGNSSGEPPGPPAPPPPDQVDRVSPSTPNPPTAAKPTAPESPETMALQLQQLTAGHRKVVMFPGGQGQPVKLPPGIAIANDKLGNTYAYRPDLISRSQIKGAARNNKLSTILGSSEAGMGAPDKTELQGPLFTVRGETPEGTETQTTAADAASLPGAIDATHRVTPANGNVSVGTPESALAERQGLLEPTGAGWENVDPSRTPVPAGRPPLPNTETIPPLDEPLPNGPNPVPEPVATLNGPNNEGPKGVVSTVRTPNQTKAQVQYRISEADDLRTSFEPGSDPRYQPRNTDRAGSRQRIEQRKGDMDPEAMGASRMAGDGAPITWNGNVITRNHGLQALKEIYKEGWSRGPEYKQFAVENAGLAGRTPEEVAAMRNPILHRELVGDWTPEQLQRFAEEANASAVARMSDAETAELLAKRLTGAAMDAFEPNEDGVPNPEFVRGLIQGLPAEEQAQFFDKNGELSQAGARIARNAVFAKAYPNRSAIERMSESTDSRVKNITNGMLAAANDVARVQEGIARGDLHNLGMASEIGDAAAVLDNLRSTRRSVEDWLNQGALEGRDPLMEQLVSMFAEESRRPKVIADTLRNYAKAVEDVGNPNQESMFGPTEPPSKLELLRESYERAVKTAGEAASKRNAGKPALAGPDAGNQAKGGGADSAGNPGGPGVVLGSGLGGLQPAIDVAGKAFAQFGREEVIPKVAGFFEGAKKTVQGIVGLLDPRRGVPTKTLDTVYKMQGGRAAAEYLLGQKLNQWADYFDKASIPQLTDMIDRMKTGQRQADPVLQQVADFLRQTDDSIYQEVQRFKPGINYLENHFRVLWKELPQSGLLPPPAKGFAGVFRRPLEGGKGFLKQHTLDTMSEGIARGGVPYTYNPLKMFAAHYADSMKFITANRLWEQFKQAGVAKFVKTIGGEVPEGYVKLDDRIAQVYFKADAGLVKAGEYYVEQNAARVMNNMLSRDLIRSQPIGQALLAVKNATTAVELSLSPFHAIFEGNEAIGSQIGIGLRQMWNVGVRQGNARAIGQGLASMVTSPKAAVSAARLGSQAKKAFGNFQAFSATPEGQAWLRKNPNARADVQAFFDGGGKIGMHEDYKIQAVNGFKEYWNSADAQNPGHYISAAVRSIPALNQAIMSPLFEHYIPNLKLGFFLKEFELAKQEYGPRLRSGEMTDTQLARQVVDSVENRFGEMNFDNLYWNRTFKTAAQMMFRSVTWKLGNVRAEVGAVTGEFNEIRRAISRGELPMLHPNTAWLLGMTTWTAILGGVIHTIATGHAPQQLKDYVYPVIDRASGIRASIPTYWRDNIHAFHSPGGYIKSSLSGEIGRVADIWQNKDFYGNEVYNADDPVYRQMGDVLGHMVPVPFSMQSKTQATAQGGSEATKVAGYLGFTKAPKYIEQTRAQQLAYELGQKHREVGGRTRQAGERSQAMSGIRQIYKRHGNPAEQIKEAEAKGQITARDVPKLRQQATKPPLDAAIRGLTAMEMLQVFDKASPDERKEINRQVRARVFSARSKPYEWTPQGRVMAQKYFGLKPPKGDLSAPTAIQ